MVVFTCGACNEVLKKNQVQKHYLHNCRNYQYVSCVDCGKDFWGDSFQVHVKCYSEEEKYFGPNYVAKPKKGEAKQEQWIQKVQCALNKSQSNPQLKNLLQRLEEYTNVPRKRSKFENFLKCSLRVYDTRLMGQVWDLLIAESQQQNDVTTNQTVEKDSAEKNSFEKDSSEKDSVEKDSVEKDSEKKLSKRERKEERQKKAHKAEKKDQQNTANGVTEEGVEKKKKGKKRKRDEEDEEVENDVEIKQKKKKKAEKKDTEENGESEEKVEEDQQGDVLAEKKGKFNWTATILSVLQSKGETSVKRLRKTVLKEYASYGSEKPEEKIIAKFNKKLSKIPKVKVLKDRAKLIC